MARGIIRKMIRGAAEAGVPMLQEQHRNNILQNRETAMARIQNQYRTQDREAEQSFTADQNAMDREQRAGEFEANRADAAEGRAIQREGLEIDRERLDQTAQQLAQTLEQGKFGIIEAQRLRGINDVITNPDSTPEQLDRAITMLQNLKNTDPEKFSAITLYGEPDEYGVQPRTSGVMSSRTGQITPASPPGAGSGASNIPQGAIDLLLSDPSGDAVREFDEIFGSGAAARYLQR